VQCRGRNKQEKVKAVNQAMNTKAFRNLPQLKNKCHHCGMDWQPAEQERLPDPCERDGKSCKPRQTVAVGNLPGANE
jgi:hypothetical protein